ncbi:hypothetical protein KIN20_027880 [Parelaphostrongylus tenuis]|uniref:Uncharacterized protein n=1 Tax=Parelaphostrongylus tenuis TaxID=148309 RepID=A0AAD5WEA3_PARTN|nr:hypothetical protein KIN20_027880 [Parelaphostrongylus tenuis]
MERVVNYDSLSNFPVKPWELRDIQKYCVFQVTLRFPVCQDFLRCTQQCKVGSPLNFRLNFPLQRKCQPDVAASNRSGSKGCHSTSQAR